MNKWPTLRRQLAHLQRERRSMQSALAMPGVLLQAEGQLANGRASSLPSPALPNGFPNGSAGRHHKQTSEPDTLKVHHKLKTPPVQTNSSNPELLRLQMVSPSSASCEAFLLLHRTKRRPFLIPAHTPFKATSKSAFLRSVSSFNTLDNCLIRFGS